MINFIYSHCLLRINISSDYNDFGVLVIVRCVIKGLHCIPLPVRLAALDENLDAGLTGSFWFFLTSMPVGLSTGSPFETIWLQVGRSTSSISVNNKMFIE